MDAMTTQMETPVIEITLTNCFHVKHPRQYHESAEGLCDSREAALAYAEGLQKYEYPGAVIIDRTTEEQAEEWHRRRRQASELAFSIGYKARRAGKARVTNPHPFGLPLWQSWWNGWNKADDEIKAGIEAPKPAPTAPDLKQGRAFANGFRAGLSGRSILSNRYPMGSEDRRQWTLGFTEGRHEAG